MKWKSLTKIAVSGSRRFGETDLVTQYLDLYIRKNFESTEDVVIITGHAVGVDDAVELYCLRRGIKNLIVNARWVELEKVAGPRRNGHIVDLANIFFGFWDGESLGTRDAIEKAKKRGIIKKVFTVEKLRKVLGIKPPTKINLPPVRTSKDFPERKQRRTKIGKIRDLIKEADIDELVKRKKKRIRKEKENFFA